VRVSRGPIRVAGSVLTARGVYKLQRWRSTLHPCTDRTSKDIHTYKRFHTRRECGILCKRDGDDPVPQENSQGRIRHVPAAKSHRAAMRRHQRKQPIRSRAKTFVRKARLSIDSGDIDVAEVATKRAIMALDKAAQKGAVHKRNASRRKSRLMSRLNAAKAETFAASE